MTDLFAPRPEHQFTFGLWTVGNPGRDPFGDGGPRALDPVDYRAPPRRPGCLRRELPRQRPRACGAPGGRAAGHRQAVPPGARWTGMKVPMVTTNLFWRPIFKEGAFTANDPRIRRFAVRKACEAIELGAEFGAEVFVLWGGRKGVEAEAAKDVRAALDRYKEAVDLCCEHIRDQGLTCASPSSRSRTNPGGTSCFRRSGMPSPSSAPWSGPRWSGSIPSSPTRR